MDKKVEEESQSISKAIGNLKIVSATFDGFYDNFEDWGLSKWEVSRYYSVTLVYNVTNTSKLSRYLLSRYLEINLDQINWPKEWRNQRNILVW